MDASRAKTSASVTGVYDVRHSRQKWYVRELRRSLMIASAPQSQCGDSAIRRLMRARVDSLVDDFIHKVYHKVDPLATAVEILAGGYMAG